MNPSSTQAVVIVDELVRNGVRQVVSCPGWRNAPLAMAWQRAADEGRVELHVRIDERSAGFLALGLAQATGLPVAVSCTSGTAVANLHPAVLEAQYAGIGLLLLTADRPPELHNSGASQTIDQRGLFGGAAHVVEFPVADEHPTRNATWRAMVCRAVAIATTGRPVQVNLPFREPLVPSSAPLPEELSGRPDGRAWTTTPFTRTTHAGLLDVRLPARTLVIGGSDTPRMRAVSEVAAHAGWPVVAEPTVAAAARLGGASVLRCGALLVGTGELPTGLADLPPGLRPDALVQVGRPTLPAEANDLKDGVPVYCVDNYPHWTDPRHAAREVRSWLDVADLPFIADPDPDWLAQWQTADRAVAGVLDELLDAEEKPCGMRVARDLVAALPPDATLYLGPSNPARDVYFAAEPRPDLTIHSNRGVAGIDGNISTAIGLALGCAGRRSYALMGDLSFLHDTNGLLIGPENRRPELTIVVLNDNGGGNFALLDEPEAADVDGYERVFGTPQRVDLAALCAAHDVGHTVVADEKELRRALEQRAGMNVVEYRAQRSALRDLHLRLRTAVVDAVDAAPV